MSTRSLVLLLAFGALFAYCLWRGFKAHAGARAADDSAAMLHAAAAQSEVLPYDPGVQPSFPSPDTLAAEDPGAPGAQPLFFGGSVPSQT